VAWPGPGGALWAAELLLWAALYLPLGDVIRRLVARRVALFRLDDCGLIVEANVQVRAIGCRAVVPRRTAASRVHFER